MSRSTACCYDDANLWKSTLPESYIPRPEFAFFEGAPGLPNILLIGDSISMSYTTGVRSRLAGYANVYRAPNNCRSTQQILSEIEVYLCTRRWDLIHFNAGIHDITWIGSDGKASEIGTGARRVGLEEYERNLEVIVTRLEATGALLVWASTTPVQPGTPYRDPGDVIAYNRCAAEVMERRGVATDDLYSIVGSRATELQPPQNVHFTEKGASFLADAVASCIRRQMRGTISTNGGS